MTSLVSNFANLPIFLSSARKSNKKSCWTNAKWTPCSQIFPACSPSTKNTCFIIYFIDIVIGRAPTGTENKLSFSLKIGIFRVSDVFVKLAPFLKLHSEYSNNYERSKKLYEKIKEKKPFAAIIRRLEVRFFNKNPSNFRLEVARVWQIRYGISFYGTAAADHALP